MNDNHRPTGCRLVFAVIICFMALVDLSARAQMPPTGLPAADPALLQLNAARSELRDSQQALDQLTEKLKSQLEARDADWAKMRKATKEAAKQRDKVHDSVLAALRATPEYAEAQESLKKAQQTIVHLTDARDTASHEFDRADEQAFAMRVKIHEMEQLALTGSMELRNAEALLQHAKDTMDDHWEQYVSEHLANDPTWTQAISRRDQAQQTVKQAEVALNQARLRAAPAQVRTPGQRSTNSSYHGGSTYRGGSRSSGGGRGGYGSGTSMYR